MTRRITRRHMLRNTGLGAGLLVFSQNFLTHGASPKEKLNIALIGIGGRGADNLGGVSGENIVALCDVDEQRAGKAFEKFPKAKKYTDFRQMLDKQAKEIDAVVVSTPDHAHFHPAIRPVSSARERERHTCRRGRA
jgi:hypothetical protein